MAAAGALAGQAANMARPVGKAFPRNGQPRLRVGVASLVTCCRAKAYGCRTAAVGRWHGTCSSPVDGNAATADQGEDFVSAFSGVSVDEVLTGAMRTAAMNHRHLANNIANIDTPGYVPTELDFQATLREVIGGRGGFALRTTQPRHLDLRTERPQFERIASLSKNDYNKVSLDEQVAKLSRNAGDYTTYASILAKRFEVIKSALTALNR